MKIKFEMDEQILRNAIDAINSYLEVCDAPVIWCQNLTEEEKEELKDLELGYDLALIGDEIHKAILSQTEDENYKRRFKEI